MIVATVIFFVLPIYLLWSAGKATSRLAKTVERKDWRFYAQCAALIVGAAATLTAMAFQLSWSYNGGSPHGWQPKPGLWQTLRPVAPLLMLSAAVASFFGRGKARWLMLSAAVSIFAIELFLSMLEMD